MTKNNAPRRVCGTMLGLALSFLLLDGVVTRTRAGSEMGKGNAARIQTTTAQQPPAAPPSGAPTQRNEAIVELEKKIAGQENKPAEEVFKNIQLFKGQPAIRVLRVMEMGFGPALGVKCVFCHIKDQWDKDDRKHKVAARKMFTMTMNLNKEIKSITDEKAVVNCYTCHRGQEKPAISPGPAKEEPHQHEHTE